MCISYICIYMLYVLMYYVLNYALYAVRLCRCSPVVAVVAVRSSSSGCVVVVAPDLAHDNINMKRIYQPIYQLYIYDLLCMLSIYCAIYKYKLKLTWLTGVVLLLLPCVYVLCVRTMRV